MVRVRFGVSRKCKCKGEKWKWRASQYFSHLHISTFPHFPSISPTFAKYPSAHHPGALIPLKCISPGVIFTARRSASVSLAWVVLAGCEAILLVSPRLAVNDSNERLFRNLRPLSNPPFNSKQKIPPPFFICFLAILCCGWLGKYGYFSHDNLGWFSICWAR